MGAPKDNTLQYNLVIIHVPGRQDLSDFLTIRNMMAGRAPDICVSVISLGSDYPADFWKRSSERPTLIFSPMPVKLGNEITGARLVAIPRSKMEEVRMLMKAGISVPESTILNPDTLLKSTDWGPFTVTKPNFGLRGQGVRLNRTRDVRWSDPLSWPMIDLRHGKEILAQKYIHTGSYLQSHRVMTVLGKPIYAITTTGIDPLVELDPNCTDPLDIVIAANNVPRGFKHCVEEDVVALAEKTHTSLGDLPSLGIDIVRDAETRKLYVLELNSSGWNWHLSSDVGIKNQRDYGMDHYGQFDALRVITTALIERTRALAV